MVTSCIEHHSVIRLNKDGSGTITEETTFGAQALAMMEQMAGIGGEAAEDPVESLVDEDAAKKAAAKMGEGVTFQKVEKIDANGRKGGRVIYAFEDISKVKYSFGGAMNAMSEGMPGAEEVKEKDQPMEFEFADGVLTMRNPNAGKAANEGEGEEAEGEDAPDEEIDEQGMAMAKQMMGDMKMSLKVELPGGISETNATYVDGNTVTFMEMNMGKLLEDPKKFQALSKSKPSSAAAMQEALKGIEGVKVETKEEITIKLK